MVQASLAILFAYNGTEYNGLERVKHKEGSIEQILFKAFPADTVSMTHISRASVTAPGKFSPSQTYSFQVNSLKTYQFQGEHASRQVISLRYSGARIPTVDEINAQLPESIRVFQITEIGDDFSARRTCEARTVEFLIPVHSLNAF